LENLQIIPPGEYSPRSQISIEGATKSAREKYGKNANNKSNLKSPIGSDDVLSEDAKEQIEAANQQQ
jgi:hypothetical protein